MNLDFCSNYSVVTLFSTQNTVDTLNHSGNPLLLYFSWQIALSSLSTLLFIPFPSRFMLFGGV